MLFNLPGIKFVWGSDQAIALALLLADRIAQLFEVVDILPNGSPRNAHFV